MANQRQTTPILAEVLFQAIENRLCEVNTALPGAIVSYDLNEGLAVVQPSIKKKYRNEDAVDLPTISNVPVCFPRMGSAWVRFPIEPGDEGQLIFQQRSIDLWQTLGGSVDPLDSRKFSLSDCTFWPGLNSDVNTPSFKGSNNELELVNENAELIMTKDGRISLGNGDKNLLELVDDLLIKLKEAKINTMLGPQTFQPNDILDLEVMRDDLAEILRG